MADGFLADLQWAQSNLQMHRKDLERLESMTEAKFAYISRRWGDPLALARQRNVVKREHKRREIAGNRPWRAERKVRQLGGEV